jgi:hypothetical protein
MQVLCRNGEDLEWCMRAVSARTGVALPVVGKPLAFPMLDLWLMALGVAIIVDVPEKKVKRGRRY